MASESTNGGPLDEIKTITIRTFSSHETAELAAANLEAHGIECWVTADDCGGAYPNLTAPGGVRLLVRVSDADAAIALLNTRPTPAEEKLIEVDAVASAPPETAPKVKLALGQILAGIVVGVLLCLLYQWTNTIGTKTIYDRKHDKCWVYRDGQLVEYLEDRNRDGIWDRWLYYDHGQIARAEYDNNFDGKPDEIWTSSDGIDAKVQKDTDFNGIFDEFCTYQDGVVQQLDMKPNGSPFVTLRELFRNGVLTETWRGGDSNGRFKEVVRYDPFLNPISTNDPAAFPLLSPSFK